MFSSDFTVSPDKYAQYAGLQQGGKVGAYSGGKGLLSMAPFSRRII